MLLEQFLKDKYNYDSTVKDSWSKYVKLWRSWYVGKVKSFHCYTIYNGKRNVRMQRLSLQMAKKCCEDWADLLFNERCSISLSDERSNEQLNDILNANDFWSLMNSAIEFSGGVGTGAVVVSVSDITVGENENILDVSNASVKAEYVDIDWIFPLTWSKRSVKECAFGVRKTIKGNNYVFLSVHTLEKGVYVIHNHAFRDNKGSLTEIECEDSFAEFNTGSDKPWFAVFGPSGTNSIYPNSPWGVPYFSGAIDVLQAIDTAYDSLNNEIQLGRKRIFASQEMFNMGADGTSLVFDESDVSVYCLPKGANSDSLIQPENSELRVDRLKEDIELNLNVFSNLTGFGQNHYQLQAQTGQTATAVVSQNSAMFRRKKKHEIVLESAIYDIVHAMAYAASAFGTANINVDGLTVMFDDSIIEDKEAQSNRALRELSAGVKSPEEYRVEIYGESEEVAEQKIQSIQEKHPTMQSLIGGE